MKHLGPLEYEVLLHLSDGRPRQPLSMPAIKSEWSFSRIRSLMSRLDSQEYVSIVRHGNVLSWLLVITPLGIKAIKHHHEKAERLKNPPVRRKYTRKAESAPKRSLRPLYGRAST